MWITFNKYLLNAYSVQGTVLGTRVAQKEDLVPIFKGFKSKERHRDPWLGGSVG